MPYSIAGAEIENAYSVSAVSLESVFDINGTEYPLEENPVTPMTWNLSEAFKSQVLNALADIKAYQTANPDSYSICQFNDVHLVFSGNDPNFIDYNKGYKVISRMLFLGDMVDTSNSGQYANSVSFMGGAQVSKRLIAMGNHEYMSYDAAQGNPETLYKALINVQATFMFPNDDYLIYYNDDTENNVRYILLDYFYITKTGANSGHLVDMAQLNWCASVMESAGSKDIIIAAHSMMNPFYRLYNGTSTSSAASLQNQDKLVALINAFKNRGTYSVEVDGVTYAHDFSNCTGNFILYTSGHYHIAGHTPDFGFNMFTGPARKGGSAGGEKGFIFFLIDKTQKTIRLLECATDFDEYETYDFSY